MQSDNIEESNQTRNVETIKRISQLLESNKHRCACQIENGMNKNIIYYHANTLI